jgi:hypothetical protein
LALEAKIKELRAQGIEPLAPESGRYFTFTRSGSGPDTGYQISVYKQKLTIEGVGEVEKDVVHVANEELARRCVVIGEDGSYTYKEAPNLSALFKRPTSAQVERIVREGETAVDEIFDSKTSANDTTTNDESGLEDDDVTTPPSQTSDNTALLAAAQAAVNTPAPTVQATPPAPAATVAAPTQVANQQATPTAPAPSSFGAPKTTAETVTAQTDAEFLKSLGI